MRELLEQKRRARGVSPAPSPAAAWLHTPLPDDVETIDSADDVHGTKMTSLNHYTLVIV